MIKNLKYICLALAGMLAVSCSKDDDVPVVEHDSVPIAFAGDLKTEETVTRADGEEVSLTEYSKQFVVTGYKTTPTDGLKDVMTNYYVNWVENTAGSTVTNTADWEYVGQGADQDIKYWDFAATDYRFLAYVPQRGDKSKGVGKYEYTVETSEVVDNKMTITFKNLSYVTSYSDGDYIGTKTTGTQISKYDLPLYSDFWSRSSLEMWNETTNTVKPVKLAFRMPFARIKVMFKRSANTAVSAEDATVTDISFSPIIPTGSTNKHQLTKQADVAVTYPLNAAAGNELSVAVTPTSDVELLTGMTFVDMKKQVGDKYEGIMEITEHPYAAEPEYYMLPRIGEDTDFELSASIGGIVQKCTVPAELMEWHSGYEYTYIFKILESGGIRLDLIGVGISQWDYVDPPFNHELYNW